MVADGSEAGSQCAVDQVDASKQSQSARVPPGSTDAGAEAGSRGRDAPLGSKPTGRKQHSRGMKSSAEEETRLGSEVPAKQMAAQHQQQLQHTRLNGDAVDKDNAAAVGDDDDDDDFKPDVRRRFKSHQAPKGSSKKAKLSLPGAEVGAGAGAHANAVGQVLLSWDVAQHCWQHRIITACSATQVRH